MIFPVYISRERLYDNSVMELIGTGKTEFMILESDEAKAAGIN